MNVNTIILLPNIFSFSQRWRIGGVSRTCHRAPGTRRQQAEQDWKDLEDQPTGQGIRIRRRG